jgi:hypothetical protein
MGWETPCPSDDCPEHHDVCADLQLAATFFGFCVASGAYDAATQSEVDKYLHDHVRNPQDVDAAEVLRIVNRLLGAL